MRTTLSRNSCSGTNWDLAANQTRCSKTRKVACMAGLDIFSRVQVEPVLKLLRTMRYEDATIERVFQADVYPPVYDFEAWRNHRSRNRYLEHIVTLFKSYLMRGLYGPLMDISIIAVLVGTYETLQEGGSLPGNWPDVSLSVPEVFHQCSFALSFMLVFRINSSYARWREARMAWGTMINNCRDLCRQGVNNLPEASSDLRSALGRWAVAYVRCCKLHLREPGQSNLKQEMKGVLKPFELALLEDATHRPLKALQVLGEIIAAAGLEPMMKHRMDKNISELENCLGTCERIFKNPIPLSYTRHTARFLFIWLTFLPFTLWSSMGWGIIPATFMVAFFLLGIDEIAIQLEEPFGILPLESLCDTVQRNVYEIIEHRTAVKDVVARYAANTGAGRAPAGWAPPPKVLPSVSEEEGIHEVVGPYTPVVFDDDPEVMPSLEQLRSPKHQAEAAHLVERDVYEHDDRRVLLSGMASVDLAD